MLENTVRPSLTASTIEAKLSSVRIMSALSFATSVTYRQLVTLRSQRRLRKELEANTAFAEERLREILTVCRQKMA